MISVKVLLSPIKLDTAQPAATATTRHSVPTTMVAISTTQTLRQLIIFAAFRFNLFSVLVFAVFFMLYKHGLIWELIKMAFSRRQLLKMFAFAAGASAVPALARAQTKGLKFAPTKAFSFEALKKQARDLAGKAYISPPRPSPEILQKIDYDAHGKIRFRPELAVNAEDGPRFPLTFFHMGKLFQKPVRMHLVDEGQARELLYDVSYFDMPSDSPARRLREGTGFAGFRVQEPRDGQLDWKKNDWMAFLGASYFRAIGDEYQYGLSARGIAINVANPKPPFEEEFPDFTHFWFEFPANMPDGMIIYALLDGPSITGAYRFVCKRGKDVIMEIEKALYLRRDVARFGIAPLTSMYWYSEKFKPMALDWRPEVHDSDGLLMWTGGGERIWRPLNNPPRINASAFLDKNPRGFGLMQRDRDFDNYHDGVHYERRPGLWVEPQGAWGEGSVQLIEIPTDDEIHDNIVAIWVPKEPAKAGAAYEYKYKLTWSQVEPAGSDLAVCVATRFGNGGQPGTIRPKGVRKFLVEFKGGPLKNIPYGQKVEPVLSTTRGTFSYVFAEAVPNDVPGHWRAQFDLTVEGKDPVDLRCYLRVGDKVLSETWLCQYFPF